MKNRQWTALYLLSALLLICSSTYAQKNKANSLRRTLENLQQASNQVNIHIDLSLAHLFADVWQTPGLILFLAAFIFLALIILILNRQQLVKKVLVVQSHQMLFPCSIQEVFD